MATDIGKVFENELETIFRELKKEHLMGWHRFPDTHSAGGDQIIQPQPSDYLIGLPPGSNQECRSVFLEAKASDEHKSLPKAAVHADQRGFIEFYRRMLQLPYFVMFYSSKSETLELWDGADILAGSRLDRNRRVIVLEGAGRARKLNRNLVKVALADFFGLPDKRETVKLYSQQYGSSF